MDYKLKNRKRKLFLIYTYALNIFLLLNELMPPIVRYAFFKMVFKSIGKDVYIDYGVYFRFPRKIIIGSNVTLSRGVKIFPSFNIKNANVEIRDNVRVGPDTLFLAAGHDYQYLHLPDTGGAIIVNDNVWIGARSTILPGVIIGEGAVIAAGSIVTKDVPEYCVVAGVPAKFMKNREINDKN